MTQLDQNERTNPTALSNVARTGENSLMRRNRDLQQQLIDSAEQISTVGIKTPPRNRSTIVGIEN